VRVVLVDDAVVVRSRLREPLAAAGVHVLEAATVAAAATLAAGSAVDFVIVDVHVPKTGLDGLTLLRDHMPAAVIIVLTNEVNTLHRRECLKRGADFFFDKSHEFERALEVVLRAGATSAS
jgi:DNA-binding NarL/FixJ family response regulator